jgi:transcriptional regulator with XRE-family HTH domain
MAMSSAMAAKFEFALKVMSMSRARLAAELGVDKSAVGRWLSGTVAPSAHNLAAFTNLIASRVEGFSALDWDRDMDGLRLALGVRAAETAAPAPTPVRFGDGLPLPLLEESVAVTRLRAAAYEGFYRSTRPYAQRPGVFVHDQIMLRLADNGLLAMVMSTGGVDVRGWVLLLGNQLFSMGAELTSGAYAFAIINGVSTVQAGLLDGLVLSCSLDPGRTPTATGAVFERIGDLTGDADADDARFRAFASADPVAPEGSVPEALQRHLVRDIGPGQLPLGGDWILRLPLSRSLSRGLPAW